jgi:hypothetical protein
MILPSGLAAFNLTQGGGQFGRSTGMGIGTDRAVAPAPMPPSQVLGGWVVTPRVDGLSAAQNMIPSMPAVLPAPFGATAWTYGAVACCSDAA